MPYCVEGRNILLRMLACDEASLCLVVNRFNVFRIFCVEASIGKFFFE